MIGKTNKAAEEDAVVDAEKKTEANEEKETGEKEVTADAEKNTAEAKVDAEVARKAEEERIAAEKALKEAEEQKKQEQLNSISMMYYLAITAEEIRTAKDNRLILDDIYTSLLNNINPSAIDETTQEHLKTLRDIISAYKDISIKRERLQYIYNQNKATAIRNAVPNPLAVLSVTNALDWKKLAIAVVYTAVDSYTSYKNSSDNADKEFLMSGWELDDEEENTIKNNRDSAFDYMVDMVQKYNLDGSLTLNEEAVENFVKICSIESVPEKTHRLESEENQYQLLGNYWLELADCYFETNKYEKCLHAVEKYNEISTEIYRKDSNYVKILPKAIVAAQQIYKGDDYISHIENYANAIIKNTSKEEWSTRYFAAQVYLDLYARTDNEAYLNNAYDIAYDNVTVLLQGQRDLNNSYLNEVKEVEVEEPDYKYVSDSVKKERKENYKKEKKKAEKYNKYLKEERKTELPALYG